MASLNAPPRPTFPAADIEAADLLLQDDGSLDDGSLDERLARICQRPDGFHWVDVLGRQEFGPFDTVEAALADMDQPADDGFDDAGDAEWAEQDLDVAAKRDEAGFGDFDA